jgi:hypothetical protein
MNTLNIDRNSHASEIYNVNDAKVIESALKLIEASKQICKSEQTNIVPRREIKNKHRTKTRKQKRRTKTGLKQHQIKTEKKKKTEMKLKNM